MTDQGEVPKTPADTPDRTEIYLRAKNVVKDIYALTGSFYENDQTGLASKLRKAAISVVSNLAECGPRASRSDQAHFAQLALTGLTEVADLLERARNSDLVPFKACMDSRQEILALARMLGLMRASILNL